MKCTRLVSTAMMALVIGAAAAGAQGKGHGNGKGGDHGNKGKDNKGRADVVRIDRGNRGDDRKGDKAVAKAIRKADKGRDNDRIAIVHESGGSVSFREFATSPKRGHRIAGLAVAAAARRDNGDAFLIQPVGNRVQVLNRSGVVLVDFDDDRELGNWKVVTEPYREKKGAPSFCRSGAGHPVWGRQWCIEKGFGLGTDDDLRWSRVLDPTGVVITRPTTSDLTRNVLLDVLGSVVLNRLATHAVTLGYQDPLTGRWLGEANPSGPEVLLVSSGPRLVAELVDTNRDGRADLMLVPVRR